MGVDMEFLAWMLVRMAFLTFHGRFFAVMVKIGLDSDTAIGHRKPTAFILALLQLVSYNTRPKSSYWLVAEPVRRIDA
jgi:hypothetical protein